ncbi:hypothetical protein DUNSADRAFT_14132 [Dunaliella salina]|uniref:Encoded protein n=1 Tax=Dunaliella salina TaxID=3046 RepID=A0ABQ7G7W9_DUNSA|nr:hypothetical protein DUNSADRAFT_14132 [Dunaliella salina]|eukprot:KAF5830701.1 hypothetical protein DUNSADRAFT_14132 [Dunaliella salina]
MKGKVQQQWQHTVPRRSPPQSIGPRINLTFRRIVHPESQTRSPKQPARLPQRPPPQAAFPNLRASAPLFPNPSATESVSSPSKKLACHSTQSLLDPRVWQLRIEQQEQNKLREQVALLQQAKAGQQASQHDLQQQLPQQLPQQQLQQPEQQQQQQQQQQQEASLAVSSSMTRHEPPSREPSPPPKMSRFESQVPTQQPHPST